MSTVKELFAPRFLKGNPISTKIQDEMAKELGADSLRYLPYEDISKSIGLNESQLCQACINGKYPTNTGEQLYQLSVNQKSATAGGRTYELPSKS